jgi:hypothetical protein
VIAKIAKKRPGILLVAAVIYFGIFFYPIAAFPIGGDDIVWVLRIPAVYGNDPIDALVRIVGESYSFEGNQARTTSISFVIRVWLALAVINLAIILGISPTLVWAGVKVSLILIGIGSVWIFMSSIRFRSREGKILSLTKETKFTVTAALPIVLASGLEVNTIGNSNGWIFYPTLSYLPLVAYMAVAVLLIKSNELLTLNILKWTAPVTLLLVATAWIINLSYELMAFSVPFAIMALLLQPNGGQDRLHLRWRSKIIVASIFGGVYSGIFIWTRIQIANMACFETGTCYGGTVIKPSIENVLKNFYAAFPGAGIDWIIGFQADAQAIAIIILTLVVLVALAIFATMRWAKSNNQLEGSLEKSDEVRSLLSVSALMVFAAAGSALITGITERATWVLANPLTPDRSGPTIALALSIAAVTTSIAWWRQIRIKKAYNYGLLALAISTLVILAASNFGLNWQATRDKNESKGQILIESIYLEFISGPQSGESADLRCELLRMMPEEFGSGGAVSRFVDGAQLSFDLFWGVPFCPDLKTQIDLIAGGPDG